MFILMTGRVDKYVFNNNAAINGACIYVNRPWHRTKIVFENIGTVLTNNILDSVVKHGSS